MLPSPVGRSLIPYARSHLLPISTGEGNYSLLPVLGATSQSVKLLSPEFMQSRHDARPTNIFFWARRGRGKTLSMTMLAKILKRGFIAHHSNWRLLSNYWIRFANHSSPYLIEDITDDPFLAEDSIVLLDEITSSNPSRRAMSRLNIDMARFIEQIRKLRCEIMFSTQFPTEVDKSLLRQVDLFILTESHIHPFARVNPVLAAQAYIDLYIFDYWGQYTGRFVPPQWPPPPWLADRKMRLFNLPSVWNQYKSSEFIPTAWGSDAHKDKVIRKQWEDYPTQGQLGQIGQPSAQFVNADMLEAPILQTQVADVSTFKGWLAERNRMGRGRIHIRKEMVKKASGYNPEIVSLTKLIDAVAKAGYDISTQGRNTFARASKEVR